MLKRYKLGSITQIPCGEGRNFEVDGRSIAVFRTREDTLFATQASCPHRKWPLADGLGGGTTLVCPLHEWSFDLTSGRALSGTCDLTVYAISKDGGDQMVLELADKTEPAVPVSE